jgi:hypothetical protein
MNKLTNRLVPIFLSMQINVRWLFVYHNFLVQYYIKHCLFLVPKSFGYKIFLNCCNIGPKS